MATKYLDKVGLAYFWSKIKAWIESTASNLMHRTGDETIEGTKAFQNSYHDSTQPGQENYTSSSLLIRIPDYDKGTDAETNHHGNIVILDKDGTNRNWNGRLGIFEHVVYGGTTRANQTRITTYRNAIVNGEEVREYITLGLGYDDDGNGYASAPSTSSLRNSGTDIVTRNWIPNDNRIVHTTGNETIDGVKTFSSVIQGDVSGTAGSVAWANVTGKPSSFTPSSHTHGNIANDGTLATANAVVVTDGSNKILASTSVTTTELSYLDGVTSSIQTQLNSKAADSGVVHTTGAETISGVKTFNNRIEIDTPNLDAVHFNHVDALLVPSTIPANAVYSGYSFRDGAGRTLVECYNRVNTTENSKVWQLHNLSATDATAQFAFTYNNSLNKFYLTGPAQFGLDDDSIKIPNTAWIRDATGNFACNAATATKLETARTINGVSFDGSTNITVEDSTKLPLTGGTMTGNITYTKTYTNNDEQETATYNLNFGGGNSGNFGIWNVEKARWEFHVNSDGTGYLRGRATSAYKLETPRTINGVSFDGTANIIIADSTKLSLSGGTMTGNVNFEQTATLLGTSTTHSAGLTMNGSSLNFGIYDYTFNKWVWMITPYGNVYFYGNADTTTKLSTARTLWGQSFDGSANVTGTLSAVDGITFNDKTGTDTVNIAYGKVATNDYFRIQAGGTAANAGYLEIATADDGNEPIYVRQYNGVFNTVNKELVLLDGNGYTHFPGNVRLKNKDVTKGTPPTNSTWWNLQFTDVNNAEMGSLQYGYMDTGQSYMRVGAVKSDTTNFSGLYVGFDADGTAYASVPSTSSTRNENTDIVTRDWIPKDTRIVHTTGNETIDGYKIFNDYMRINKEAIDAIRFYDSRISTGAAAPDSGVYQGMYWYNNNGKPTASIYRRTSPDSSYCTNSLTFNSYCPDNPDNGTQVALIYPATTLSQQPRFYIGPELNLASGRMRRDSNNSNVAISGGSDFDNNSLLVLYGKDYSNNNGGFALTARNANGAAQLYGHADGRLIWNNENIYNVVHRSGNEIIEGNKTFTSLLHIDKSQSSLAAGSLIHILSAKFKNDSTSFTVYPISVIGSTSTNAYNCDVRFGSINGATVITAGESGGTICSALSLYDKEDLYLTADNNIYMYVKCANDSTSYAGPITFSGTAASGGTNSTTTITATTFNGNASTATTLSSTLAVDKGGTGATTLDGAGIVTKTGDQTIGGNKIFSSSITVSRSNPYIVTKDTDFTKGSSNTCYAGLLIIGNDSSNEHACRVLAQSDSNSTMALCLYTHKNIANTNDSIIVELLADTDNYFMPRGSNGTINLGGGSNRWKQVYAANATISTSDERMKDSINSMSDKVLDAWEDIQWHTFKYKDAINDKGIDNARVHTGLIAQHIERIFKNYNLDASKYGFYCYDKWDERYEYIPEKDENGNETDNKIKHKLNDAGDAYSIRYEEALCVEAAYQRRKNKVLENRISELEKQVSDMIILLQNLTNSNG